VYLSNINYLKINSFKSTKMKKIFLLLSLVFLAIFLKAQTDSSELRIPKIPATLIMPDGSVVPTKSLDSIQKARGWEEVSLSFQDDGVHIHPLKSKAEQMEDEKKLNGLINKPAPEFSLQDITGKQYSLASLRGKIVVLNFWFTQCGGCLAEMSELNKLKQDYEGKDVVFLALTFDDAAKIKAFLAKKKFEYSILPTAKKTCMDYGIYGYPTSMVIDREGIVKFVNCSLDRDIKSQLVRAIDEIKPI
jgi:peroxiredoxin